MKIRLSLILVCFACAMALSACTDQPAQKTDDQQDAKTQPCDDCPKDCPKAEDKKESTAEQDEMRAQIERRDAEIRELRVHLDRCQAEMEALENQNHHLKAEHKSLRKALDEEKVSRDVMQDELAKSRKEYQELLKKVAELLTQINQLKKENE